MVRSLVLLSVLFTGCSQDLPAGEASGTVTYPVDRVQTDPPEAWLDGAFDVVDGVAFLNRDGDLDMAISLTSWAEPSCEPGLEVFDDNEGGLVEVMLGDSPRGVTYAGAMGEYTMVAEVTAEVTLDEEIPSDPDPGDRISGEVVLTDVLDPTITIGALSFDVPYCGQESGLSF